MMKRIISMVMALLAVAGAWACTSAIVSGRLTRNGRPLLWKNRDTNDLNNRVKAFGAHDGCLKFVAIFDSRDRCDTAAWMGYNERGFAIMNTASYNLNADSVPACDMDKEGVVMRLALERCATVEDFGRMLDSLPKPMGVEANFGVIDATGAGAYFETGNFGYVKYDLSHESSGILMRTNYSCSGRTDEGNGYVRDVNEQHLVKSHIAACDFTPATFTEEISRTFYHSLLGEDFTRSGREWLVDQDFIPRRISSASVVIEGVAHGEDPVLTTMWTALGYPPCAEVRPVWLWPDGVPQEVMGQGADNHAPLADSANVRKEDVFPIKRGNGSHYLRLSKLYNSDGTGYCQVLVPRNMATYERGYEKLAKKRAELLEQKVTKTESGKSKSRRK